MSRVGSTVFPPGQVRPGPNGRGFRVKNADGTWSRCDEDGTRIEPTVRVPRSLAEIVTSAASLPAPAQLVARPQQVRCRPDKLTKTQLNVLRTVALFESAGVTAREVAGWLHIDHGSAVKRCGELAVAELLEPCPWKDRTGRSPRTLYRTTAAGRARLVDLAGS